MMIKFLSKLVFAPVAVVVVLFAVGNRDDMSLSFWPLPFDATMPAYLAVLGALAIGIVLGIAVTTFAVGKWRLRARASARNSRSLERRLATEPPTAPTPVPARPALPPARGAAVLDDD